MTQCIDIAAMPSAADVARLGGYRSEQDFLRDASRQSAVLSIGSLIGSLIGPFVGPFTNYLVAAPADGSGRLDRATMPDTTSDKQGQATSQKTAWQPEPLGSREASTHANFGGSP